MRDLVKAEKVGELIVNRKEKAAAKKIESIQLATDVVVAQRNAEITVIAETTRSGLLAAAHLSTLEAFLVDRIPMSEARLRGIADAGCVGIADTVWRAAK